MGISVEVWVMDANVFIDLEDIRLVDAFFALGNEIHTTSLVWEEVQSSQEFWDANIETGRLIIHDLTSEEREEILALREGNMSEADGSVLLYALQLQAILLTGEKKLRTVARRLGLEVHGSIWLLDHLVETEIISIEQACESLRLLMAVNIRLPKDACEERIAAWCN